MFLQNVVEFKAARDDAFISAEHEIENI